MKPAWEACDAKTAQCGEGRKQAEHEGHLELLWSPALLTWASADCGDKFMETGVFVAGMLLPHIYPLAGAGGRKLVIQFIGCWTPSSARVE